jgi:hypothetical protein
MTQPFILKLTNGVDTADFLSSSYRVLDGGFDIGLPQVKKELVPLRPGFYIPQYSNYEYRTSKLQFDIRGTSRSDVISKLQAIERILYALQQRSRLMSGSRCELLYTWEGSTNITYFEVYSGEISFPADMFSVAKIHRKEDGLFVLPEIVLTLNLSSYGYGVDVITGVPIAIPLWNTALGSNRAATKTTAGVLIGNPGNTIDNFVEIADVDLPGASPYITKLSVSNYPSDGAAGPTWGSLYIGHTVGFHADTGLVETYKIDASTAAKAGVNLGPTTGISVYGENKQMYYYTLDQTYGPFFPGIYYVFLHANSKNDIPSQVQIATKLADAAQNFNQMGEFVSAKNGQRTMPLGMIQLPVGNPDIPNMNYLGGLDMYYASDVQVNLKWQFYYLMPVTDGLRIWNAYSGQNDNSTFIDDDWKGIIYSINDSTGAWQSGSAFPSIYGLLNPITLAANRYHRLYFDAIDLFPPDGPQVNMAESDRRMKVWLSAVPTYQTLAF